MGKEKHLDVEFDAEKFSDLRQSIKEIGIPFGLLISKSMLEIGARIIKTETELVLKSRNVIPKRLTENGFEFQFGDIDKTFKNLLS